MEVHTPKSKAFRDYLYRTPKTQQTPHYVLNKRILMFDELLPFYETPYVPDPDEEPLPELPKGQSDLDQHLPLLRKFSSKSLTDEGLTMNSLQTPGSVINALNKSFSRRTVAITSGLTDELMASINSNVDYALPNDKGKDKEDDRNPLPRMKSDERDKRSKSAGRDKSARERDQLSPKSSSPRDGVEPQRRPTLLAERPLTEKVSEYDLLEFLALAKEKTVQEQLAKQKQQQQQQVHDSKPSKTQHEDNEQARPKNWVRNLTNSSRNRSQSHSPRINDKTSQSTPVPASPPPIPTIPIAGSAGKPSAIPPELSDNVSSRKSFPKFPLSPRKKLRISKVPKYDPETISDASAQPPELPSSTSPGTRPYFRKIPADPNSPLSTSPAGSATASPSATKRTSDSITNRPPALSAPNVVLASAYMNSSNNGANSQPTSAAVPPGMRRTDPPSRPPPPVPGGAASARPLPATGSDDTGDSSEKTPVISLGSPTPTPPLSPPRSPPLSPSSVPPSPFSDHSQSLPTSLLGPPPPGDLPPLPPPGPPAGLPPLPPPVPPIPSLRDAISSLSEVFPVSDEQQGEVKQSPITTSTGTEEELHGSLSSENQLKSSPTTPMMSGLPPTITTTEVEKKKQPPTKPPKPTSTIVTPTKTQQQILPLLGPLRKVSSRSLAPVGDPSAESLEIVRCTIWNLPANLPVLNQTLGSLKVNHCNVHVVCIT